MNKIKVGDYVCRDPKNNYWSSALGKCPNGIIPHETPVKVVEIYNQILFISFAVEYKGEIYGYTSNNIQKVSLKEIEDD